MTEAEEQNLRDQLKAVTAERNSYHAQLTDMRLKKIEERQDDHEERLRAQETIGTRFNTVYALFGVNIAVGLLLKFAVP